MDPTPGDAQALTHGEFLQMDALITLALEQGLALGDKVKAQSDVCCCGAVTAETRGKFVFEERDREIVRQIAELEQQIDSAPTVGQLIEIRNELLKERQR